MRFYTTIFILFTLSVLLTVAQLDEENRVKRRMYAMCPPKFQRIGSDCYAISDQRMNWLEAHFQCKDKNSKLAEPNRNSDRKLRSFFEKMDRDPDDIWIGATYDWHSKLWQWSISGKNLTYDAFSQMDPESRKNLEYHCAVFNPSLKYRWSARSCVDKHRYICQHKMPKVSEKNRNKVYARWNQTFPDQLANEVLLEVIDTKGKDGKRIHRRVKPVDSGENYPIRADRRTTPLRERRRRPARLPENLNDISVSFIPNDQTNEINGGSQYYPTSSSTPLPIVMKFIPGDLSTSTGPGDVQAAQAYPDAIITRSQGAPKASPANNETVEKPNRRPSGQGKRTRNNFDKIAEQKRRKERERKRAIHLRRKQLREQRQRAKEEEEKRKQQQAELDELKQKQAEEDKQLKEQEQTNQAKREKLAAESARAERERELKEEAELKIQEEQREEEERARKQRLHEENRLRLEHEEKIKQQETDRDRQLEEEKRISEENRRRAEEDERKRQEELKRLQEEDEERLELQRVTHERKHAEEELARLEEENRKRIAAQKAREDEIRRREEELARQEAEEKRLQEELQVREEQDRLQQQEQIAREAEEKRQKEEMERRDREYQEQLRREKEEKLKRKIEEEAKQLQEEEERKRKERAQKYVERISRLSPEARTIFLQARQRRKKNKNSNNEVTIPERK